MANIPLIIPDMIPAISPAYQVGFIFSLSEKKKKYTLSASKTIPSKSVSAVLSCDFIKYTAKYVAARQPTKGKMIFFQFIFFHVAATTVADVHMLKVDATAFASVYKRMYGRNIIENMPNPNPVVLCKQPAPKVIRDMSNS